MAEFTFECPHCGERVSVEAGKLGEVVVCPACGLPFLAAVPSGRLMKQGEGGQWESTGGVAVGGVVGADGSRREEEKTVRVFRPAALRQHPVQSFGLIALAVVGFVGGIWANLSISNNVTAFSLFWLGMGVGVLSLLALGVRVGLTRFESLRVTTQRSVWTRGVLNRLSSEVQHDDIRNIQVAQGLAERLLGVGTVSVSSAGQDDMEISVVGVPRPRVVVETVRKYQGRLVGGD
ncbi:MAG: PH domain-containing protein [Planctomycetota bacterium]